MYVLREEIMKKFLLICLFAFIGLLVILFILKLVGVLPNQYANAKNNLNFIGTGKGIYEYSDKFQNPDGSFYVVSTLNDWKIQNTRISIMKLSPDIKMLWEKLIPVPYEGPKDAVISYFIKNVTVWNDHIYLLATEKTRKEIHLVVIQLSLDGQLLKTTPIQSEIESEFQYKTFCSGQFAYVAYIDHAAGQICLQKIDMQKALSVSTAKTPFHQKALKIKSIIVDPDHSSGCLTIYDPSTSISSWYRFIDNNLKETVQTKPGTEIIALKHNGNKLYGIIREDSLLEVADLTDAGKPIILVTDKIDFNMYRPQDLAVVNGGYAVCFNYYLYKGKKRNEHVVIRKYTTGFSKFTIQNLQSREFDNARSITVTPDGSLLAFGNSVGGGMLNMGRIFANKFKM